jgi:TPP-dependent pyruvate/acetoin dehydrogenase alpha subunit
MSSNNLSLYRSMLRIRLVEEAIVDRYPEQEMRCPVHLSIGQEATAVGTCSALHSDDVIVSTHRSHGHYLAKGGDLFRMIAEIYGRVDGCCGGRGGSMHLFDQEAGVLASVPIVGSTIPLGVGAALVFQQRGESRVSVVFLGDAASEEGVFHESLNFASVHRLPVVFVIENNLYSVYTPLQDRQPVRPLTAYAGAHGMPSSIVDGNDACAMRDSALELVEIARNDGGPSLLVADTYRWREHCGPSYDNDLGYRDVEEYENWRQKCPVEKLSRILYHHDELTQQLENNIRKQLCSEIQLAFDAARASPFPSQETAGDQVYA